MFIAHAYLKIAVFTVPGFEGFLGRMGYLAFLAGAAVAHILIGDGAFAIKPVTLSISPTATLRTRAG